MRPFLVALALALGLAAVGAGSTAANRGVALDVGAISIGEPLVGGSAYSLPPIGVRNPGTEAGAYAMAISGVRGMTVPDEAWFVFEPDRFELQPGQTQSVAVQLLLPRDTRPSVYAGLLVAQLSAGDEGARVGAAAAARISFEVRANDVLQVVGTAIGDFVSAYWPWSVAVPGVVVAFVGLLVIGRTLSRRYSIRLERRA